MLGILKCSIFCFGFIVMSQSIFPVWAQEPAKLYAKTMFVSGTVNIIRTATSEATPLARGDSVFMGDRVMTGPDSKAILVTIEKKLINVPANAELNVAGGEAGRVIAGLGMGMFASGTGRSDVGAQAATRKMDDEPLLLYPRNSRIRDRSITLQFAPLAEGEQYEIEVVGVTPQFVYPTKLSTTELLLTEDRIGRQLIAGEAYYVYVRKINAQKVELQQENGLRVGLLTPEEETNIAQVEEILQPLMNQERDNPAYPTLLAETYESNCLHHDAIRMYEKIINDILPDDAYSRERLRHLYTIIRNPPLLRTLDTQ